MSPSTATTTRPKRSSRGGSGRAAVSRRRTVARRRRRVLRVLLAFGVVAVGIALAMPLLQKAVNELTLPLSDSSIIRQQAAEKHLDPALIAAVIYAETKFDPRTSSAGALGLMQMMPQTAQYLARQSGGTGFTTADLAEPAVNIAYGSYYLRFLLNHYHGDEMFAIAAYNGGITNVDEWIAAARSSGHRLTIDDIPFPETRDYVLRVLQAQRDYRNTYASQLGYG
jgi:soluble lytic murein transglycosylase